jgi:hypothetical protein
MPKEARHRPMARHPAYSGRCECHFKTLIRAKKTMGTRVFFQLLPWISYIYKNDGLITPDRGAKLIRVFIQKHDGLSSRFTHHNGYIRLGIEMTEYDQQQSDEHPPPPSPQPHPHP